jgi:hypothetical protein
VIQVAKRHNLFFLAAGHIVLADTADDHAGDPQFVAGSLVAGASQHVARDHERRQAGGDSGAPGHGALGWFVGTYENAPISAPRMSW